MTDKNTPAAKTADNATTVPKPKLKRHLPWRWFLVLLILILLLGAGYYLKGHHQNFVHKQQGNRAIAQLNQARLNHLYQHQQEIIATQNALMQRLQQKGVSGEPLALADALQMLRRAQFELQATQDSTAALQLLQLAQTSLQRYNSVTLNKVQQAIGADIKRLQAINVIDAAQTVGKLLQLQQDIDKLSLTAMAQAQTKSQPVTDSSRWHAAWQQTVQALQQVVVVQHTTTTMTPLLSQQQLVDYKLYLQGLLQQAVWGVLHKSNTVYHGALQQTQLMLQQHFPHSNTTAQDLLQDLQPLQALDVQPVVPQQLASITLAKQVQQQLLNPKAGNVA